MRSKEIIFFDGDGTLWYPRSTKFAVKPHWVYAKHSTMEGYSRELTVIPTVVSTLKALRKAGIITVILSTHPQSAREAAKIIDFKSKHLGVAQYFNEIHATRHWHKSKGQFIERILKQRGIPKTQALMVGDSYAWDYKSARDVGVDAVLIDTPHIREHRYGKMVRSKISRINELLEII